MGRVVLVSVPEAPARRVVMLGASNLAIHLPTVVETAARLWGRPLDLMTAMGHGRSYGMTSRVMGRVLPGILQCGLWSDLERRPPVETAGLATDIGNDLLYGVPVEQIAAWVDECLRRLARVATTLVVTELPLASTHTLSERRFLLLRNVFFPRSQLTLDDALEQTVRLNAAVRELAEKYRALTVKPSPAWYGFDPIHIRRTRGAQVWREILAPWSPMSDAEPARLALRHWLALRRMRPLERELWGRVQRQPQPAGRLPEGTAISLY
jgi:hypothetical protein